MDELTENTESPLKRRPDLDVGIYVAWEMPDGTIVKLSTDESIKEFLETGS